MAKTKAISDQRALLLRLIDECYNKTTWHGPNLKSAVRRVTVEEAVWRPRPGRRNIAEIVMHCAYWSAVALAIIVRVKEAYGTIEEDEILLKDGE